MVRLKAHQTYGYILFAPLCSVGDWNEAMPNLIALVEQARSLPYVDNKRIYLTGNSMGGYGTWALATLRAIGFLTRDDKDMHPGVDVEDEASGVLSYDRRVTKWTKAECWHHKKLKLGTVFV